MHYPCLMTAIHAMGALLMFVPFLVAGLASVLLTGGESSAAAAGRKAVVAGETLYLMTEDDRLVVTPLKKEEPAEVLFPARTVLPPVPGCWDIVNGSLYLSHVVEALPPTPTPYIVEIPLQSIPRRHDSPEREELDSFPFKSSDAKYKPLCADPLLGAVIGSQAREEPVVTLADMHVGSEGTVTITVLQNDELRTSTINFNDRTKEWEDESPVSFEQRLRGLVSVRGSEGTTVFSQDGPAYRVSGKSVEALKQRKRQPGESKPPSGADVSTVIVVDKRTAAVECLRFALREGVANFCPDYRKEKPADRQIAAALERALAAQAK